MAPRFHPLECFQGDITMDYKFIIVYVMNSIAVYFSTVFNPLNTKIAGILT